MIVRNYFNRGYEENARVLGLASHIMIFSVWLKLFIGDIEIHWLVVIGLFAMVYFTLFGWGWDKLGLFEIDKEFLNRRDPMMKRIAKEDKIGDAK